MSRPNECWRITKSATVADDSDTKVQKKAFIPPSKALIPTDGSFGKKTVPVSNLPLLPSLNLPTFGNAPKKEKSEAKSAKVKSVPAIKHKFIPQYDESDIVSDAEFIKRTHASFHRDFKGKDVLKGSIHDDAIKRLFFANGGCKEIDGVPFYECFDTLAQAYESLRNHKLAVLAGLNPEEYKRVRVSGNDVKVFVPGGTTYAQAQVARDNARAEADLRNSNDMWLKLRAG